MKKALSLLSIACASIIFASCGMQESTYSVNYEMADIFKAFNMPQVENTSASVLVDTEESFLNDTSTLAGQYEEAMENSNVPQTIFDKLPVGDMTFINQEIAGKDVNLVFMVNSKTLLPYAILDMYEMAIATKNNPNLAYLVFYQEGDTGALILIENGKGIIGKFVYDVALSSDSTSLSEALSELDLSKVKNLNIVLWGHGLNDDNILYQYGYTIGRSKAILIDDITNEFSTLPAVTRFLKDISLKHKINNIYVDTCIEGTYSLYTNLLANNLSFNKLINIITTQTGLGYDYTKDLNNETLVIKALNDTLNYIDDYEEVSVLNQTGIQSLRAYLDDVINQGILKRVFALNALYDYVAMKNIASNETHFTYLKNTLLSGIYYQALTGVSSQVASSLNYLYYNASLTNFNNNLNYTYSSNLDIVAQNIANRTYLLNEYANLTALYALNYTNYLNYYMAKDNYYKYSYYSLSSLIRRMAAIYDISNNYNVTPLNDTAYSLENALKSMVNTPLSGVKVYVLGNQTKYSLVNLINATDVKVDMLLPSLNPYALSGYAVYDLLNVNDPVYFENGTASIGNLTAYQGISYFYDLKNQVPLMLKGVIYNSELFYDTIYDRLAW